MIQMDRDTLISLATLPDSRTRATVSNFFCETDGALEIMSLESGMSPEDRIVQGLVARFVNIAVTIAGDSDSVDEMTVNGTSTRAMAVAG